MRSPASRAPKRGFFVSQSNSRPQVVTLLEKRQLKTLPDAVSEAWGNVNFVMVNGQELRVRVVTDGGRQVYVEDSDELICCLEAHPDTADGATINLGPHELLVVPRNTTHRLRVEGAVMLINDAIKG